MKFRNFTQGKDEEVLVSLTNQILIDYEDFRPLTLDEMLRFEKNPRFDPTGIMIAEFNGTPVGCITANADKKRKEKKGFIQHFGVIPKFRRKGIGKQLLERALQSLSERGMESAEIVIQDNRAICKKIAESLSFTVIRTASQMTIGLEHIPSDIGENKEVSKGTLNKESLEDIKAFNRLNNEAFKEHFNYRPRTLEETRFWIQHNPMQTTAEYFISHFKGEPVGFVGVAINTKTNEYRNRRRGEVTTIGVLKPHRLKGIGTSLMLHGLEHLRSEGMEEAALWVDDQNPTKAIKLYKKVGFKIAKKSLTYQKKLT